LNDSGNPEIPGLAYNLQFQIKGWDRPEEIVIVDGHFDSVAVGDGAMDDGAASLLAIKVLLVLRDLGLRPRRTIRVHLWAGEETWAIGSSSYFCKHVNDSVVFLLCFFKLRIFLIFLKKVTNFQP
jgi:carboxypeptidase Q